MSGDIPSTQSDQGWAFPFGSRKAHYFRSDHRALCGKWSSIGMPPQMFDHEGEMPSSDDCVACRRRLTKEGVL